ncbi:MAG TPA: DinB family protein [Thermoanaerobaculia bacterium]
MSTREYFSKRLAAEMPAFVKVIRALPEDQLHYKPHEKNTPAGALAWQIATEMAGIAELAESGEINYKLAEQPSLDEIATAVEKNANLALERLKSTTDELWNRHGRFLYGGQVVWEASVEDLAWGFLLDLVHHRGQLSAYLRPMGGKVPPIYGPSADDRG